MKHMKKNRQIIGLVTILGILVSPTIQAYNREYLDHVANAHLQSFPSIKTDETPEPTLKMEGLGDLWRMARSKRALGLRPLNARDKHEISFKQALSRPIIGDSIDRTLVEKLLLVRGETDRPGDHLMYRLITDPNGKNLLKTSMGAKCFVEMISQATTDVKELARRQSIIKALVENNALREACNNLLSKMEAVEPYVYDLYSRNPESESEKTKVVGSNLGLNGTTTLTITTRLQETFNAGSMAFPLLLAGLAKRARKAGKNQMADMWKKEAIVITLLSPLTFVGVAAQSKVQWHTRLNMQERLIGMATYLTSLKELVYTLGKDKTVGPLLPTLKKISQQLQRDESGSDGFNKLNRLLSKRTFSEGNPSGFSSPGRIVNAYREIIKKDVREEYAQALNLLGQLDVYVALANKIKAHHGMNAEFCFAEFIENSDKPVIKADNFWNPFVDPTMVVGNDVSLNTGQERDIILTGPNTGGKSTIMKALMFSVLLAQTFGIAPAKSLEITPFTKLLTYLNIADDTGAGVSLFKAEVNQAKAIMETVRALKPNEFVFLITDEMFTGTSPDKGEELSFNFAKQLAALQNCIFIQATHFRKLTELPALTKGICKNYYTGVIIEGGKVVKYTYKLVPGISPISTADQIAKEEEIFDF